MWKTTLFLLRTLIEIWSLFIPSIYGFIVIQLCRSHKVSLHFHYEENPLYWNFVLFTGFIYPDDNNNATRFNWFTLKSIETNEILFAYRPLLQTYGEDYRRHLMYLYSLINPSTDELRDELSTMYKNAINEIHTETHDYLNVLDNVTLKKSEFISYILSEDIHQDIWNMYLMGPLSVLYFIPSICIVLMLSSRFQLDKLLLARQPHSIRYAKFVEYNYTIIEKNKLELKLFVKHHNLTISDDAIKHLAAEDIPHIVKLHCPTFNIV